MSSSITLGVLVWCECICCVVIVAEYTDVDVQTAEWVHMIICQNNYAKSEVINFIA